MELRLAGIQLAMQTRLGFGLGLGSKFAISRPVRQALLRLAQQALLRQVM